MLTKCLVKNNLKFCPVSQEDVWKVNVVKELIDVKCNRTQIDNLDIHQIDEIIQFLSGP